MGLGLFGDGTCLQMVGASDVQLLWQDPFKNTTTAYYAFRVV